MTMVERAGLSVDARLARFVEEDVIPGTGIAAEAFWQGAASVLARLAPRNAALLAERERMQAAIDAWHRDRRGQAHDAQAYRAMLEDIGYLLPEPPSFTIDTANVDPEIAVLSGPQLVVPILNARFALNAANARWGSLYDALYGTDALGTPPPPGAYDSARGSEVVAWAKAFLDRAVPLARGSWTEYAGGQPELQRPEQFVARSGDNLLFVNNGLHIEVVIDRAHAIGAGDPGGIADVVLEAALTTICDLEDSVAAVDAEDKVAAYRNWLGLVRGDLVERFEKGQAIVTRSLRPDRSFTTPDGGDYTLPGRALLLLRNVGHLMTTPAVILPDGTQAPEGIVDALVTALVGLHDLRGLGSLRNSRSGSLYIVKPKMHGPAEVAFADELFAAVEEVLGLARNTIKLGLMDEERRTSANLAACISAVRERLFFINTGFLDRTGDEIHTSMQAGPMVRKADMKDSVWLKAYEDRNVQIGLACGLAGRAQIGKGMWAAPDRMADMIEQKIGHPRSGASTAWVPSPTAAVLHAVHYHQVDVRAEQDRRRREAVAPLDDLLTIPVLPAVDLDAASVREELDNNAQGLLGYVSRWVEQGIGCSKVPDINDIGLMEDRATLRISSQHMANWLLHGIASPQEVEESLARMAKKVDEQNAADPAYGPMAGREQESLAFQAGRALVFEGLEQPSGYTEPLLHAYRAIKKGG